MTHTPRTHRLGLLVPSSNSTQEPEFIDVLPRTVSLHVARLTLTEIDPDQTVTIVDELEQESRKLGDADVGGILLAATAPSSRKGMGYDRELVERIRAASGKPATTASTSMLEAFGVLGIRRIALAAPWSEAVNRNVVRFMNENGIEVTRQEALGILRNNDVGRLEPQTAYDLGRKADTRDAQAVFLACGNWWNASIIEDLEQDLGKPVLTTNIVSIWGSLGILGYREPIEGYGQLLREHMQRETAHAQ